MKSILFVLLLLVFGCNKKESYNLDVELPDSCYNINGSLDSLIKINLEIDIDHSFVFHGWRTYDFSKTKNNGKILIATYTIPNMSQDTYLLGYKLIKNYNDRTVGHPIKCFYIRWEGGSVYPNILNDSTEINTNLDKRYVKMIFPNHVGRYNYEKPEDTLYLSNNSHYIDSVFVIDGL